jgi:hypothetical protein
MFWRLTPRELLWIVQGHVRAQRQAHEAARMRNYELAQLIGFAVHDPKKMPKYEPSPDPRAKKKEVSTEADEARVRAFFINLAMRGHQ